MGCRGGGRDFACSVAPTRTETVRCSVTPKRIMSSTPVWHVGVQGAEDKAKS